MIELVIGLAAAAQATVTECDRLAAHPSDPDRVAEGVSQSAMDKEAAIAACAEAVAADPDNPRLNYQLARALGYAGRGGEAGDYRAAAVAGDYPQALFVVGYLYMFGLNEVEVDKCRAADLVHRSALKGRLAGQLAYPHWALEGHYVGCDTPQDLAEMRGFVEAAKAQAGGDFYQGILIESLEARLGMAE